MKHSIVAAALASLSLIGSAFAQDSQQSLMGYTEGAQVIEVGAHTTRIDTISGIVYKQVKSQRAVRALKMTVMIPRTSQPKPAVVYFPGGGFTSADHEKFIEMRYALAREGFVVAACEYRAVPTKFPGLIEDAKAAVRFLRANAKDYGIDADRIGVVGDSAGGYVVQMLGAINGESGWDVGDNLTQSSQVQAVVSLYGISDLTSIGEGLDQDEVHGSPAVTEALLLHGPAFKSFAGATIHSDPDKARQASPLGHIDGTEPPFLILHGSADRVVSPKQSQHLYEALTAQGVDAQYVLVRGAQHGDDPWFQSPIISRVTHFLRTQLGAQKADPTAKAPDDGAGNL